jgi:hypothetical protein
VAERLESVTEAIHRLEKNHLLWACWCLPGGAVWYARRTGPLSDAERASGTVLAPLEASDPDGLEALIREQDGEP